MVERAGVNRYVFPIVIQKQRQRLIDLLSRGGAAGGQLVSSHDHPPGAVTDQMTNLRGGHGLMTHSAQRVIHRYREVRRRIHKRPVQIKQNRRLR